MLRLPDNIADKVRYNLRNGEPMDLGLVFGKEPTDGSARPATFRIDETELPAALSSLPTLVEVQKSIDNCTFYKTLANGTGTVRQVIDVSHNKDDLPSKAEQLNGLTPPMFDIRRRKWRKRIPRDPKVVEQVALEVEALVRGGAPVVPPELVEEEIEVRLVRRSEVR